MLDVLEHLSWRRPPYIQVGDSTWGVETVHRIAHLKSCYVLQRNCQSPAGPDYVTLARSVVGSPTEKPGFTDLTRTRVLKRLHSVKSHPRNRVGGQEPNSLRVLAPVGRSPSFAERWAQARATRLGTRNETGETSATWRYRDGQGSSCDFMDGRTRPNGSFVIFARIPCALSRASLCVSETFAGGIFAVRAYRYSAFNPPPLPCGPPQTLSSATCLR